MLSNTQVIEMVIRASRREARFTHLELERGVPSLLMIATAAPLIGFFYVAAYGIMDSFQGCNGERTACLRAIAGLIGDNLTPSAFGIVIGVAAWLLYQHLRTRIEELDLQMESAAVELGNFLSLLLNRPDPEMPLRTVAFAASASATNPTITFHTNVEYPPDVEGVWSPSHSNWMTAAAAPFSRIAVAMAMLLLLYAFRWAFYGYGIGWFTVYRFEITFGLLALATGTLISGLLALRQR